ncbi:hypothetical protein GGR25_002586 [Kaistia hirudinis]|uniref:Mitochondrial inner membrane protein n=1 Tax=Kaistia hirudinis TaxID=1293440 RepID=A0A840AT49_9HYPH|nr:mitofilin family membrane protein [Kaistia hirudinis]MBB3931536.1 hypothetical protein [Kaistia hirudinis]
MQDADKSKPEADRTGEARRKRPPVTIDLEAEAVNEVAGERTESPAEPEVAVAPEPEPHREAEPARPAEPEANPDPEVAVDTAAIERRRAGASRYVPVLAAAVLGGVVGGVLVAFLNAPQTDTVNIASIDSRFATLAARLDKLETADNTASAGSVDPQRFAALEQQVEALRAAPSAAPAAAEAPAPVDLGPLDARIAALESRPAAVAAPAVDLSPVEARVTELAARLDQLVAHPPVDPKTEAAALTIALTSLRQAASSGRAFAGELSAYAALGGKAEALAPLAAAGAPSLASLEAAFPAIADRIRADAAKVDPDASVWQRLAASAGSLVSVKPAGPIEGSSTIAVVSRMEAAVARGDLPAALRESDALDQAAKVPLADWAEGARRRVAIDAAIADLPPAGASNG